MFDAGIRELNAQVHMLDLPKEWLAAMRAARDFHLEFPPLAGVGALFTVDATTGATKEIVPLGLSTLIRPRRYLRWAVAHAGLWRAPAPIAPDFEPVFTQSVLLGGATLELALTRAADGMVVWGEMARSSRLLHQALDEGQPHGAFVRDYVNALPGLAEQRTEAGDSTAAQRYVEFAARLHTNARLASLATAETLSRIALPTSGGNALHGTHHIEATLHCRAADSRDQHVRPGGPTILGGRRFEGIECDDCPAGGGFYGLAADAVTCPACRTSSARPAASGSPSR